MPNPSSERVDAVSKNLVRFLNHLIRQNKTLGFLFGKNKKNPSVFFLPDQAKEITRPAKIYRVVKFWFHF
jgi:hypothetical protein